MILSAFVFLAVAKILVGFLVGLTSGRLFEVNPGGVPMVLPWAISAYLGYVALRCWRDGGLDARFLALLWGLTGSWLADRPLRVVWAGAGEIMAEGAILGVYLLILVRLGILKRMAGSVAVELRRVPRWVWFGVVASPVIWWSTPGAWIALTGAMVYGPAVLGARATVRILRV